MILGDASSAIAGILVGVWYLAKPKWLDYEIPIGRILDYMSGYSSYEEELAEVRAALEVQTE